MPEPADTITEGRLVPGSRFPDSAWILAAQRLAAGWTRAKVARSMGCGRTTLWRVITTSQPFAQLIEWERLELRRDVQARIRSLRAELAERIAEAVHAGDMRTVRWLADRMHLVEESDPVGPFDLDIFPPDLFEDDPPPRRPRTRTYAASRRPVPQRNGDGDSVPDRSIPSTAERNANGDSVPDRSIPPAAERNARGDSVPNRSIPPAPERNADGDSVPNRSILLTAEPPTEPQPFFSRALANASASALLPAGSGFLAGAPCGLPTGFPPAPAFPPALP